MGTSIIIPAYNYGKYLGEAIESALNQTVKPLEIIVVNDGSQDNTSEVAKQYPVTLIEQANKGLPGARNTGIRASKGEYVLCLDADDTLDPYFLEMTEGTDDIVATYQQEFGERNNVLKWLEHPKHDDFKVNNQIPAGCLFKREIWDKIGGYDETMTKGYEDWDFWFRATKVGYTVTTVLVKLFNYRIHGDSMINNTRKYHAELLDYILNKQN